MSELQDTTAELRTVVAELTDAIEAFRASVNADRDRHQCWAADTAPEQVRDVNGRPILADLLAAKATALAALTRVVGHD